MLSRDAGWGGGTQRVSRRILGFPFSVLSTESPVRSGWKGVGLIPGRGMGRKEASADLLWDREHIMPHPPAPLDHCRSDDPVRGLRQAHI